jgi:anti-sigma regulatory factor (Ser/Thr protein kinase)
MSAKVSLKVKTSHDELGRITAAVEDLGEREDWPPALAFKINLVLEELAINVMNHGHDEGLHDIEIALSSDADTLTIEIADDGRPFDPLHDAPTANTAVALEDRQIGGLGIHLVRSMMDELHYRREQGRNCLTLITRIG